MADVDDIGLDPDDLPPRLPARGRPGRGAVSQHPRIVDAERRTAMRDELEQVEATVREISAAEMTASQRVEKLLTVNSTIILNLLKESLAEFPDLDRSTVLARALAAVKDTVGILRSKHDMESVDSFNPRSPKFGIVFGWFIELVHKVLGQHVDETTSANFFNDLVTELSGWEDKIERQFKGVSGKALASLTSPFVEVFREQVREVSAAEAYYDQLQGQISRAEARLSSLQGECDLIMGDGGSEQG